MSIRGHRFETGLEGGIDVKLYDLAGQVEYYGLHQLFLTEKALYVLVWDASKFLGKSEVNVSLYGTASKCASVHSE